MIQYHSHGQMSEAFLTAAFLSFSGGLQDAYTYMFRGKVFANAQTGNIVLLSQNLYEKNWGQVLHYLVPLIFFALGVLVAEQIHYTYQHAQNVHWRQLVLAGEIVLLFGVGFLPQRWNVLANAFVSFACAMQVQAFRKVTGYDFSSTMCIGNLRSSMEAILRYSKTKERKFLRKAIRYWEIIFLFGIGAGVGGHFVAKFGSSTIWVSCVCLLMGVALMSIREEIDE